ncbi:hypothetical protein KP509_26G025200 [Ceratopteris richardii]|uniref:Amine oxidase domain-containing protein n=1 Tax=Ceratopteris richardii TaxID=49495 RepID=A0A8T2RKH7_CERRI|nr:hypothetical protein KP509_26G025200 [Ceratopteris richardii]
MARVAIVGAGVSGLFAARTLALAGLQVVVYEKEGYVGGHARTEQIDGVSLDLGFMVFNRVTYPNMLKTFDDLGVEVEESDMSFAISVDEERCWEWSSNGLSGLFAQKTNAVNPSFLRMVKEITKFQQDVLMYLDSIDTEDDQTYAKETLKLFVEKRGYSNEFLNYYLVPMCASIWSCSLKHILESSAASILTFLRNHHLLQIFGRPQWLTVKNRSKSYVDKIVEELKANDCDLRVNCAVARITSSPQGVQVQDAEGHIDVFNHCIVGAHAPDAIAMLGSSATPEELSILGAFQYNSSDIYLHRDAKYMPKSLAAWSAWNFLGCKSKGICVTYWLNKLQNLGDTGQPFLVTLNPVSPPSNAILKWKTSHPIPSPAAAVATRHLSQIQGKRGIWFCGAYQGYGFHEDGAKSGLLVANELLGHSFEPLKNLKHVNPTWPEYAARLVVTSFLRQYIQTGYLEFQEAGGSILKFGNHDSETCLQCVLRINKNSFYWKIAARADIGLADAYIDGDFTCVDKERGLLNLLLILINSRDHNQEKNLSRRSWWNPVLLTSVIGSASSYFRHLLRNNSLTNARRNIAAHYDLSNALFSLFLDESMTYSCAMFKNPKESLRDAQMNKIRHIIKKAQIEKSHEVLEIGFGWGSMALEIVKETGCKYTGITLSEEQLKLAEERVKEAGLEDNITFLLCDYRTVPGYKKFDRIISCEMLEAVGHEHFPKFFQRCDHLLAKDGIVVVQVITIPEERYDAYRSSSDFIKEYIFPGGCLPSFSILTTAMAAASSLSVEHMENIGIHYYHTLLSWRERFHANESAILKLGFGEKFLRMWDYYFVYCAAGFQSCTLGVAQVNI